MKKTTLALSIAAICALGSTEMGYAATDNACFSFAEFQQNCPRKQDFTFTAVTSQEGKLTATHNTLTFTDVNKTEFVRTPEDPSNLNILSYAGGTVCYGYKSGNNTVCHYTYAPAASGSTKIINMHYVAK
jgi:hypothetical protein